MTGDLLCAPLMLGGGVIRDGGFWRAPLMLGGGVIRARIRRVLRCCCWVDLSVDLSVMGWPAFSAGRE